MHWITDETGWILPDDDGAVIPQSPMQIPALGAGLSAAAQRLMVGCAGESRSDHGEHHAARAAAMLLCGGISAAGGSACFAPDTLPAALQTGASLHQCGILAHCDGKRIRIFANGLLPLTEAQRNTIGQSAANPVWMHSPDHGALLSDRSLNAIYTAKIRRLMPAHMPFRVELRSASALAEQMLRPVFAGGIGETVTLRLSADGRHASFYSDAAGWVFYEKLLLAAAIWYLENGEDTAIPAWLPHAAEPIAKRCGRRLLRCAMHPDGTDAEARQLAVMQGYSLDGAVLGALILRICSERGLSLRALAAHVPECHAVRRMIRRENAADALIRCSTALRGVQEPDGLRIRTSAGEALLHPAHSGRSVTVFAEGSSMEAANELAGDILSVLNGGAGA